MITSFLTIAALDIEQVFNTILVVNNKNYSFQDLLFNILFSNPKLFSD